VNCSRVPYDKVSWLKTRFFNVASSFFEPCHLIIGQLDVIVCIVWALLVSYAWPMYDYTYSFILKVLPDLGEVFGRSSHNGKTPILRPVRQQIKDTLDRSEFRLQGRLVGVRPWGSYVFQLVLGQGYSKVCSICRVSSSSPTNYLPRAILTKADSKLLRSPNLLKDVHYCGLGLGVPHELSVSDRVSRV
jgi:hypothetical protein